MSVAVPTIKVEIKFTGGPDWGDASLGAFVLGVSGLGDPSATYTDVSSDVRSVGINRGKSRELEEFRSGVCKVVLGNNSRQYDPTYTSGPNYGNIKPGRMMRVYATHPTTAVTTLIYKGVIRAWDYGYQPAGVNKGDATATVLASDILYDAGQAEFSTTTSGGLSGQQVISVLDEINLTDRSIDTGIHSMQATTYANTNVLSALRTIAYSEGVDVATVYGSKSNQLIYEDAISLETKANVGTFGPSALPITKVDLTYESDLVKNSIAFTRTGGAQQTDTDTTSITDYGTRSLSRSGLVNATDGDVSGLASLALDQFKDAELRIRKIQLAPQANATLMTKVLAMEIRDLLTVEFSPPGTGTISQDHFVIGIDMQFRPQKFIAGLTLNSETGKVGGNFILGYATLGTSKIGF
tara:strand:- start:104 stop:1333 length:1230 start_codon:yes stop_codon:yes gene_type:complete